MRFGLIFRRAGHAAQSKRPEVAVHLIDPTGSGLKSYVERGVFESAGSCFIDGIGITRKTANFATAQASTLAPTPEQLLHMHCRVLPA